MRADKRRQLERIGWTVGDAGDFLELSPDERRFVEVKLALADGLRRRRPRDVSRLFIPRSRNRAT
ncbi:MAG: hypothetical protein AB7N65_26450 [Vicinamibacterales bacterium]